MTNSSIHDYNGEMRNYRIFYTAILIVFIIFIVIGCTTPSHSTIQKDIPEEEQIEPVYQKSIVINELAGWNTCLLEDEDGDYSDWVELYNISPEPVNLKGWYLSDDRFKLNKWMFSATYILNPGEYLVIYLSGKDKRTGRNNTWYHTNFSINNSTETLFLTSSDRIIQDTLEAQVPLSNTSIGRSPDGISSWEYFPNPTPGESNSLIIPIPELSHNSGFYNSEQPMIITAKSIPEGYELRYTINDGIEIDDQDRAINRHDWIYPSNKSGSTYKGSITVKKTSVVKARLYKGISAGPEAVYTYFINENIDIPVISLTTDPANLWDDVSGIYVTGSDPENPNYLQKDWEIPARFTYFTDSSRQVPDIDIFCQLKIFGSATRGFPNKSLAIYSREREIPNLFFRNNSDTVYSLLLRTGASDFPRAIMRDIITSELVRPLGLDVQDYQQALLFINGQFWGISNIREKVNEEMLEDTYQIDPKQLDLVFGTYTFSARNGTSDAYIEMFNYITKSNLYLDRYYNQVEKYIDIDSFIDYIVVETFINNGDWPANNVKAWKSWEPGSLWRWIIYDTDASYDTEEFWSQVNLLETKVIGRPDFNSLNRLLTSNSSNQIIQLFKSLMQNQGFKERFFLRYEQLVGSESGKIVNPDALLGTNRLLSIVDMLAVKIEPYITRQLNRWIPEYPSYMASNEINFQDTSINRWYHQIEVIRDFANQRPGYAAQFIEEMNISYIPTGNNLLQNGSFDENDDYWNLRWSSDISKQEIVRINNNNIGSVIISDSYQSQNIPTDIVSFVHDGVNLVNELTYELSFSIKCDADDLQNETILAYLFKSSPDYTRYAQIEITPTTEWQNVKTIFTLTAESDPDARLQFRVGKLPPGTTMYIDDVSLMELE